MIYNQGSPDIFRLAGARTSDRLLGMRKSGPEGRQLFRFRADPLQQSVYLLQILQQYEQPAADVETEHNAGELWSWC